MAKLLMKVVPVMFLVLAWCVVFGNAIGTYKEYDEMIKNAESSIEEGLYEQAVEFYKEAYAIEAKESLYMKIKEAYDLLYEEEHTSFVRNLYITDMEEAATLYKNNHLFWLKQAELYMEGEDYKNAYSTVNAARNYGVENEEIDTLYYELLYMVKTDYKIYSDFKMALNGYISAFDGNYWVVLDESGAELTSKYDYIGLINENGKGLYISDLGIRILDDTQVTRVKYDVTGVVEAAGYYNETDDLMPIKVDGVWKYINSKSEFLNGEFEIAGSFWDGEAVVKKGNTWFVIDKEGNQTSLDKFEDIKLDLYDCHIQGDVILAKENGKYNIYDTEYNKISSMDADGIDICINNEPIAFMRGGKWGYVTTDGEVVVEPIYTEAKSFSNGYAAVKMDTGLWGFINEEYELVIKAEFVDAFYFTESETCFVSRTDGCLQMMHFIFE